MIELLVQWWDARRRENKRRILTVLYFDLDSCYYGYELSKAAGVRLGAMYPILTELEQAGVLKSDWDVPDPNPNEPRRRFYMVTPFGRSYIRVWLGQVAKEQH